MYAIRGCPLCRRMRPQVSRGNEIPFGVTQYSIKTDLRRQGTQSFVSRCGRHRWCCQSEPVGRHLQQRDPWHVIFNDSSSVRSARHKGSIVCLIVRSINHCDGWTLSFPFHLFRFVRNLFVDVNNNTSLRSIFFHFGTELDISHRFLDPANESDL